MSALDTPLDGARDGSEVDRALARERVRSVLFGNTPSATTIDRFTVLECLGSGGMGSVYAAYDPRLDRKIALKLLRDGSGGSPSGVHERHGRLLREARAMARLSHPNVGVVHDVGVWAPADAAASLVWIAMEFIDGEDVLHWCRRARPSAREIIDAYLQLGRGLVAAHEAGLVHRDVKPDNAMRDRNGHVRVLDFGLAHLPTADEPRPQVDLAVLAQLDLESFTQTGTLVGTPAYMAPEQFEGGAADARSDQYAFCVALFTALWHVRPHVGDSAATIAEERRLGRFVQPAWRRDVPRGLRAILLRGLAPDPAQRWPDMATLLRALERTRGARRRVAIAIGAFAVVGAIAIAARDEPACATEPALAGVWDEAARTRVRDAFALDDRAFVPATTAAVIAGVDAYVDELGAAYHDACVATHETRVQSQALLDRQSACLDLRRARLDALVAIFAAADREVVERATRAVEALEPIAPCRDRSELLAVEAPAPDVAEAVAVAEAVLARAASSRSAGRFDEAATLAHEGLAAAIATEHAPVLARAHLELALAESERGHEDTALAHATDAHFIATGTQQHGLAARAATVASDSLPAESASRSVAQLWHRAGTAAASRMHDGERAQADTDIAYGTLLLRVQEIDGATEALERGTAILRRRLGADARDVWQAELMLARALVSGGRIDEAKALVEHAIAQAEPQLGDDPPRLATALASISELHQFTGDMDAAQRVGARALALLDANLGVDHPVTIDARVNHAAVLHRRRERERAAELLAQSVASCERIGDGARLARSRHIQAIVLKALDRLDEALAAETASAAWYRTHTPDAPRNLVLGALTIGNIQLLRDDYPAAEAAYREAIALVEQHGIVDRAEAAYSDFANFLFQTGRATEAVARWEALLARMRAQDAARYDLAQYEFDLGRALWREAEDRDRARAVVTAALAVLRSDPPTAQVGGHIRRDWTADELAKWLEDPDAWERD